MAYFAILTVACVVVLLSRERRGDRFGQAILKLMASTGFIGCALAAGAPGSSFGRGVLFGLALSWLGDACLLSRRRSLFLAGLVCFLLAHVAYATVFVSLGVDRKVTLGAGVALAVIGTGVARWLLPRVEMGMHVPVISYVVVISAMVALGTGAASVALDRGAPGPVVAILVIAPAAFYLSDLAVARDRFVERQFVNRLWGLPLYYGAQILFAISTRLV